MILYLSLTCQVLPPHRNRKAAYCTVVNIYDWPTIIDILILQK